MVSYIDDMAAYLDAQISGMTVATNIFRGYMPANPAKLISIYPAGGNPSVVQTNPMFTTYNMHIIVREADFDKAMTLADSVVTALHTLWEYTGVVTTKRYLYVKCVMAPTLLSYDYTDNPPRVLVAIDFEVTKDV